MPRHSTPFFREARRSWNVHIAGKEYTLGRDKAQAFARYHELMQKQPQAADISLAVGIIDAFLEWVKQNKSPRTYVWYLRHCQAFARSISRRLAVSQLKPHHVTALLNRHPTWSSATKNGPCRAAGIPVGGAARTHCTLASCSFGEAAMRAPRGDDHTRQVQRDSGHVP